MLSSVEDCLAFDQVDVDLAVHVLSVVRSSLIDDSFLTCPVFGSESLFHLGPLFTAREVDKVADKAGRLVWVVISQIAALDKVLDKDLDKGVCAG